MPLRQSVVVSGRKGKNAEGGNAQLGRSVNLGEREPCMWTNDSPLKKQKKLQEISR